jgi:hypothetical protein
MGRCEKMPVSFFWLHGFCIIDLFSRTSLHIGVKRVVLLRALEKIVWFSGLVNCRDSPKTVSESVYFLEAVKCSTVMSS